MGIYVGGSDKIRKLKWPLQSVRKRLLKRFCIILWQFMCICTGSRSQFYLASYEGKPINKNKTVMVTSQYRKRFASRRNVSFLECWFQSRACCWHQFMPKLVDFMSFFMYFLFQGSRWECTLSPLQFAFQKARDYFLCMSQIYDGTIFFFLLPFWRVAFLFILSSTQP